MRVLVTYGSRMGGTAGIAEMIAQRLTKAGMEVDVQSAADVREVAAYEAVIVGGALYGGRWHKAARRFAKTQAGALTDKAVWLFSSGPLDTSANTGQIAPVPQVEKIVDLVHARGHVTFGGRLPTDVAWFPASAMAKTKAGDWRDRSQIELWADGIAIDLERTMAR